MFSDYELNKQLLKRGISDRKVISVMSSIPREKFVPIHLVEDAYIDSALKISNNQTISQPFMVAYMTEILKLTNLSRVLEVGTGSGYHTAVLASIAKEVYTVEIIESLLNKARIVLEDLNFKNIIYKHGDGSLGLGKKNYFDAIILTAAPDKIPTKLINELKVFGKLVAPVGKSIQELILIEKKINGFRRENHMAVRFVPLTSEIR